MRWLASGSVWRRLAVLLLTFWAFLHFLCCSSRAIKWPKLDCFMTSGHSTLLSYFCIANARLACQVKRQILLYISCVCGPTTTRCKGRDAEARVEASNSSRGGGLLKTRRKMNYSRSTSTRSSHCSTRINFTSSMKGVYPAKNLCIFIP